MIRSSFCILDGIGEKLERRLWGEGILTWDDFRDAEELPVCTKERKRLFDESLFRFQEELEAGNASFFSSSMKRREHWRLFDFFGQEAVCLDIETNGLQPYAGGYVTVVGLYDGYDYTCLVRGRDLTLENLQRELDRYKFLITFYGAGFDIPFLLRSFRGLRFSIPHFDLCFGGKRIGLEGGLKKLEADLGIEREEEVQGLNGYDAVRLWEHARRGSLEALNLLVQYNREDTVNLMGIASTLYGMLRQSTGIEEYLPGGNA